MEDFVLIEKNYSIIPIDQYEKLKTISVDEKLPLTTDIKEWSLIKNLPKLLNKHLSRRLRNRKDTEEFLKSVPSEPTIVSASIEEANFLMGINYVDIFFGGSWWILADINGVSIGFAHEGVLPLCDIPFQSIVIDKDKSHNNEVFLGIRFDKIVNEKYIFKWGDCISVNDIQKRNRDLYKIENGRIELVNFMRSDE